MSLKKVFGILFGINGGSGHSRLWRIRNYRKWWIWCERGKDWCIDANEISSALESGWSQYAEEAARARL